MSNDKTEIIPTVPVRRSILRPSERSPFASWRDATPTEELPATEARSSVSPPSRPTDGRVARHLRAALAGTLLAIVAISGLSSYAAAGIADARQAAADRARSQVSVPR